MLLAAKMLEVYPFILEPLVNRTLWTDHAHGAFTLLIHVPHVDVFEVAYLVVLITSPAHVKVVGFLISLFDGPHKGPVSVVLDPRGELVDVQ